MTTINEKWLFFCHILTPTPENFASFFEELIDCLGKGTESWENFITVVDFSKDVKIASRELAKFEEFCRLFHLTNLIRYETCFNGDYKSTIDLILTNKPESFQNIWITETGLCETFIS